VQGFSPANPKEPMQKDIALIIERFKRAAKDPGAYARSWKEANQKDVIGFFCSYAPEEIILATGALPFRLFGSQKQISLADAHLQAYSCSLVRGALEDALSGGLDFLKGTVFPHTCDSIMRLSDMWRMNLGFDFHIDVVLPVKLDTQNAREYMIDVMRKFKRDLEREMRADITDEQIRSSVKTINRIRELLRELYDMKSQQPLTLSGSDLNAIFKGCMIMDRYEVRDMLEDLLGYFRTFDIKVPSGGKRILLAGGLCNMPDIFEIIETSGGFIVSDDFCTGSRYVDGQVHIQDDMIVAIADRYAKRVVCPAKHFALYSRGDHVLRLAREKDVDGVIFLYLKFCDPHAFDYPYMKDMLDNEGIPSMLFEIEDQLPSEGQFKTRCEAFIEML
jgi:bzd-type benzoyl-CoA reductase N subunit